VMTLRKPHVDFCLPEFILIYVYMRLIMINIRYSTQQRVCP